MSNLIGLNKGGFLNAGKVIKKGAQWVGRQITKEAQIEKVKDLNVALR
jgi:hypothetical protein